MIPDVAVAKAQLKLLWISCGNKDGLILRNSKWMRTLGPEFLAQAFNFAHQADPNAMLYYNDYNIESGPKHDSSMVLLKRLLKDGAPIHAVGIQGHWRTGSVPYDDIDKVIADYASLGLKVSITELDVTIRGASGGQFGRGFGGRRSGSSEPPSAEDLKAQAEAYAKFFAIFREHEEVIERVTFWGLNDRRTWRFGQHPLIFDANNQRDRHSVIALGNFRGKIERLVACPATILELDRATARFQAVSKLGLGLVD